MGFFGMARRFIVGVATAFALLVGSAGPGFAADKKSKNAPPEIPRCPQSLGTLAIDEPENQWWRAYNLGSPEALIKLIVRQSGCFNVVNRGRALALRGVERDLADDGELQRGSNVGKGQLKSADFYIIPDLVGADSNAGGAGGLGGVGGLVGGTVGGLLGGIKTKKLTAHTLLTLVNARTTEEMAVAEGRAQKTDLSWGGGGFLGFAGGVAGGYADTEIGQIITVAYMNAYTDMVKQLGVTPVSADAPSRAFTVVRDTEMMNAPGGKTMKQLKTGDVVYPTGEKDGVFVKVTDEFDIQGWVTTEALKG
jgi:curli biogenesis system outer membrane secretion channel CsgG